MLSQSPFLTLTPLLFFINCWRLAGGARVEVCHPRFCSAPDGCFCSSSGGKPWTGSGHQKRAMKAIAMLVLFQTSKIFDM
uniref:Secreted protein n=1 Tax=Aegilops tauschii subsp. strangulata TaxID=200361 RepID=A0A453R9C3_AEGTS